jgi:glycosyltransferase involved in cell wall biosynthesis
LIKAVPLLQKEIPELEVIIAGDGEYRAALEELARKLDVQAKVRFIGFVPSQEMSNVIAQSDVGVITILYDHLLPSKLFEYMVSRRPVVSSSIAFIESFCTNGEVLFYPTGDEEGLARSVIHLYRNGEERVAMVERAAQLYEKCRWPEMRRRYVEVYRSLTR